MIVVPSDRKSRPIIDDGHIEINSNTVEQSIRPIVLNRKTAHFAGPDAEAEHWATVASLVETAKLNESNSLGFRVNMLARIINGYQNGRIDELSPWSYSTDKTFPTNE